MRIRNCDLLKPNKTYVMGILNVTPDSFSDGGKYADADAALQHAGELIAEGADVIDVGGESTRPGFEAVDAAEELERILPVITGIWQKYPVPISVDTRKTEVAAAALDAGADIINDISFLEDPAMAKLVALRQCGYVLMHNRKTEDEDFIGKVCRDFEEKTAVLLAAGVNREQIMLDPGIGFNKTYEQNLELLQNLDAIVRLGYPVLLGCSRKSVIGLTLNVPENERLEGTLATTAAAHYTGCRMVRVHDVRENVRFLQMLEALHRG